MESKFFKTTNPNADWSDHTFVFACVSVGNIGQLATDLLISSLPGNTHKCGHLISPLVQPIVGPNPYINRSSDISLSCELYENTANKVVIFQQRAPLFQGKRRAFVSLLIDFIRAEKFKETVCLTSAAAVERVDSQLTSASQCRYLSTCTNTNNTDSTMKFPGSWKPMEKRMDKNRNVVEYNDIENENEKEDSLIEFVPQGGIAQQFFKASKEKKLDNVHVLIVFAHKGNTIPETFQLANYLNEWKQWVKENGTQSQTETSKSQQKQTQWHLPISWKYLFGHQIDHQIRHQIF